MYFFNANNLKLSWEFWSIIYQRNSVTSHLSTTHSYLRQFLEIPDVLCNFIFYKNVKKSRFLRNMRLVSSFILLKMKFLLTFLSPFWASFLNFYRFNLFTLLLTYNLYNLSTARSSLCYKKLSSGLGGAL